MTMKGKAFEPRVSVVGVGASVEFPNQDALFHNVFSVSGDNRFDLQLYKKPKSASKVFDAPGHRAHLLQHPPADERLRHRARQPLLGESRRGRRLLDPERARGELAGEGLARALGRVLPEPQGFIDRVKMHAKKAYLLWR